MHHQGQGYRGLLVLRLLSMLPITSLDKYVKKCNLIETAYFERYAENGVAVHFKNPKSWEDRSPTSYVCIDHVPLDLKISMRLRCFQTHQKRIILCSASELVAIGPSNCTTRLKRRVCDSCTHTGLEILL